MTTRTVEQGHAKYLMPAYGEGFTLTSRTVADMISECLATGIMCFLAEEEHLAEEFFKLESLEAGEILQKFRNYGIRFAVVVSPDRLRAGRFREMVSEEKKGHWFSAFTQRIKAEEWLADKPRLCIIDVPYCCGDDRPGASRGPELFLRPGLQENLAANGFGVTRRSVKSGMPFGDSASSSLANCREVARLVQDAIAAGEMPLVLAGSCDVSKGVLSGFDHAKCGIIWLDAHGDFNTPDSTVSGFFPGMSLALLVGHCYKGYWAQIGNSVPIHERNVLLLGVRDLEAAERERLLHSSVQMVEWRNGRPTQVVPVLLDQLAARVEEIYLHFDLDAFHPFEGGISQEDLRVIMQALSSRFRIRAATLAGYNPEADPDGRKLEAGLNIIGLLADTIVKRTIGHEQ